MKLMEPQSDLSPAFEKGFLFLLSEGHSLWEESIMKKCRLGFPGSLILSFLIVIATTVGSAAPRVSVEGTKAMAVSQALSDSGVKPTSGADATAEYNLAKVSCAQTDSKAQVRSARCEITVKEVDRMPTLIVIGKNARLLFEALSGAGAVKVPAKGGKFHILAGDMSVLNAANPQGTRASFADLNAK